MPVDNHVSRLKIGENEYACKQLKCTMEDIKEHNNEVKAWEDGYRNCQEDMRKWREKATNEILYGKKDDL